LRLFSFGGYRLALAALALVVFGAIECPPAEHTQWRVPPSVQQNWLQESLSSLAVVSSILSTGPKTGLSVFS